MKHSSRKDFTILLGNVVDHFDISIYSFLAPIIAPLFFPHSDPVISLIMAYSIFATSIVTRPVGTYIFGMIAKNYGPSVALSYSLIGVGMGTLIIGMLPDYKAIGVVAPILLIMVRMVIGVFASGESAIAKLYILRDKSGREAFKSSYIYQISSICGIVLASIVSTFIYYIDIDNSWRFVFFLGGIAAIIGYILRRSYYLISSDSSGVMLKFYDHVGIKILWNHKIDIARIAVVNSFSHFTYVIPFVTMNHLVPLIADIELKNMMVVNSLLLVFDMLAIFFIGRMISCFKPTNVMLTASCVLAITIIPLWYFIENASFIYISFVRLWVVIWGIVFLCPLNLWCRNQISGNEKYIIVGMGTTLGASVIGKMAPSVCLALYHFTGSYMSVAYYIAIMFALAALMLKKQ